MSLAPGRETSHALDLLERALGYTRDALATVGTDRSRPSPCTGWSLADLLAHMDDGLDAFWEAAEGTVGVPTVPTVPGSPGDVEVLQAKACRLLAAWTTRRPATVTVGDRHLPAGLLVSAAALEIAVHGWDVGRTTGRGGPVPDDLAVALMPVAQAVVTPADRPGRFAPPVRTTPEATAAEVLLGFLGRDAAPANPPG